MPWNWQLPNWPKFTYNLESIALLERQFLLDRGRAFAFFKTIDKSEQKQFVIEILSQEGIESAKIEGEILDRASLQSAIKGHFGLKTETKEQQKESGLAQLTFQGAASQWQRKISLSQ